jgi:tRNA (guanine-N7-)-methyltransferase
MLTPDGRPMAVTRTFKPRRRRMSPTRTAAFERLMPLYGLEVEGPSMSSYDIFGRTAPVALEIGCGAGEAAIASAGTQPNVDLIAADVHTPGIARLLVDIETAELSNLRVIHGDALEFLNRIPLESIDEIRIWFPDPWLKPKQRQRRIITQTIVARLVPWIVCGGRLRMATDIDDYAEQMLEVCAGHPELQGGVVERPSDRPITRFERKGIEAGRSVTDLAFVRNR